MSDEDNIANTYKHAEDWARDASSELYEGCPPVGYPTEETRCTECPRRRQPMYEPTKEQREIIANKMIAEWMETGRDAAYSERNKVVAALAAVFPSGIARTDIPGWEPEWHGCVYIDLPTGQASWHYHDRDAHLFAHLPPYTKPWDGHTTGEKYERLAAFVRSRAPAVRAQRATNPRPKPTQEALL